MLPIEVEEYLSWLAVERGRSANTLTSYRRDLRAYAAYLDEAGLQLGGVTDADVQRYVGHLRSRALAPASVARAMVAVRSLHRFCLDEGRCTADPAADVETPRVPQGLPKALSEAEVESLIDAVTTNDAAGRRDRALLELLYGTGMRISELVGLGLSDLDPETGLVRVMGKGAKERVIPVGRLARRAVLDWLDPAGRAELVPERWRRRSDADALFLNIRGGRLSRQGAWGIVGHHGDRVGLSGRLSPHVLRHSCATHMLDHGADIRSVQELLGHASISTTQVYTMVSPERLLAAYDAAHPRAFTSR